MGCLVLDAASMKIERRTSTAETVNVRCALRASFVSITDIDMPMSTTSAPNFANSFESTTSKWTSSALLTRRICRHSKNEDRPCSLTFRPALIRFCHRIFSGHSVSVKGYGHGWVNASFASCPEPHS